MGDGSFQQTSTYTLLIPAIENPKVFELLTDVFGTIICLCEPGEWKPDPTPGVLGYDLVWGPPVVLGGEVVCLRIVGHGVTWGSTPHDH